MARDIEAAYAAAAAAPENVERIGELGMLYHVAESPAAAADCFKRAAELEPKSVKWWYLSGISLQVSGQESEAIAAFEKAVATSPGYGPAMVGLADLLRERAPERARGLYESTLKANPASARAYVGLGQLELKQGRLAEAIGHFRKAVESLPSYPRAQALLAEALERDGKFDEAERIKKAIVPTAPPPLTDDPYLLEMLSKTRSASYLARLSVQFISAGMLDQAAAVLRRASETDPTHTGARENLGIVLAMQGRYTAAIEEFKTILVSYPSSSLMSHLALALFEVGHYTDALKSARGALKLQPDNLAALDRMGTILLWLGRAEESVAVHSKVLELDPESKAAGASMALSCIAHRRYAEAVEAYLSARGPQASPEAARGLVRSVFTTMAQQARAKSADPKGHERIEIEQLSAFRELLAARGLAEEAMAFNECGTVVGDEAVALASRGEFDKAAAMCRFCIDSGDRAAKLLNNLGAVYLAQGQYAQAAEQFRKVLESRPIDVDARSNLAMALLGANKLDEAESVYRSLAAEPAHVAMAEDGLGMVALRRGRHAEAVGHLERARQAMPHDGAVARRLAEALAGSGRTAEATALLDRVLDSGVSDAGCAAMLAGLHQQKGDANSARAAWNRAVRLDPRMVEAYMNLASLARSKRDYAEAVRVLRQGLQQASESPVMANALAWILATCPDSRQRDAGEAIRWAARAALITEHRHAGCLDTLAAAFAEAEQFDDAVAAAERAVELAAASPGGTAEAEQYRRRLEIYKKHLPFRDSE